MSNSSYEKAFRKQQKTSYKYLDENQKKYIKAKQKYEQFEKALNYFYSHCPRNNVGAVNWGKLTDAELDNFEYYNKEKEKAYNIMNKLENIIDVEYTLNIFLQVNTHSMSF